MKKKHIYLFLCFLWMVIIFLFSNQPAEGSQGLSNSLIEILSKLIGYDIVGKGGIFFDTISFIVRKAAHMSEYAILAILFVLTLRAYKVNYFWLMALLGVMLYAASDEFHQLFIMGRSGQLRDVMIDTIGGCIGIGIFTLVNLGVLTYKKHKAEKIANIDNL